MSDSVKQYQQAFASLTEAEQRACEIVASVSSLAQTISDWRRLVITGATVPDQFRVMPNISRLSPDKWPSFDDFRIAVSTYHEASLEAKNIWLNMTSDEKVGLNPPQ